LSIAQFSVNLKAKKGGRKMNQLILVGRLTRDPILRKQDGKNVCNINIAVKRQYKNSDGIYESDFINCTVWNVIAERVNEYCRCGDMVSVKGHIQNNNYIDKEEKPVYKYEIVADQVAFMQSTRSKENEEEENLVNAE